MLNFTVVVCSLFAVHHVQCPLHARLNWMLTEVTRQTMPLSQPTGDVSCAACDSDSLRKAAVVCTSCGDRWHTSCAKPKLTLAQARALDVWHCSVCLGKSTRSQAHADTKTAEANAEKEACASWDGTPEDFPTCLAQLRGATKVIRLIPKPARIAVANSLSCRINEALASPSPSVWWRLFSFAFSVLKSPGPRTERKCSLATLIKRQATEEDLPRPKPTEHDQLGSSSL